MSNPYEDAQEHRRKMAAATPQSLLNDIVADSRRSNIHTPSSMLPPRRAVVEAQGSGWAKEIPIGPQPHIDLIDRMVERLGPKPWTGDR